MAQRKRFQNSVIIGKFLPPHRGHHFLIESALRDSENLQVFVCERDTDFLPAALRAAWLREIHPRARFTIKTDVYDPNDSQLWANLTRQWLGFVPDAVWTSENYGHTWAKFLGCQHVLVDLARQNVPISATKIRENPLETLEFLHPTVRAHFVKRVVILGAESTGTTTLARDLAAHFGTIWVEEYGREFCEKHWSGPHFAHIAREQGRREDEAAKRAHKLLFCDTNAYATQFWHERYLGFWSPQLEQIAARCRADFYILTGAEIPFVQDGWRDGQHIRAAMHARFEEKLRAQNVPFLLVEGTRQARLETAARRVEKLLNRTT